MQSIADPPPRSSHARFDADFGQRFLLTLDIVAERDETGAGELDLGPRLEMFQRFCEDEGVTPVYFVDRVTAGLDVLRDPLASGAAEIGIGLRPSSDAAAGEEAKRLRSEIENKLAVTPAICRADPLYVSSVSPEFLVGAGLAVDSSVRAKFDYGAQGGGFARHPAEPYWLDGPRHLLELPQTAVFWGLLRKQGEWLYPALEGTPVLRDVLARTSLLERLRLAPEEITVDDAIRAIDIALDDGLPLLVFTFDGALLHPAGSRSTSAGDQLAGFYDWWRRVLAYLALREVRPTTVASVVRAVTR